MRDGHFVGIAGQDVNAFIGNKMALLLRDFIIVIKILNIVMDKDVVTKGALPPNVLLHQLTLIPVAELNLKRKIVAEQSSVL